jgi:hypothetical protein
LFQRALPSSSPYAREPAVMRPVPPPPAPSQEPMETAPPPLTPRGARAATQGGGAQGGAYGGAQEHEDFVLVPKDIPLDAAGPGALDLKAIFR